jgi:hypothetical protein
MPLPRSISLVRTYEGHYAALASCHGKEQAIAPAMASHLGLQLTLPDGIDTDALGAFSGEVMRELSMLETVRKKARLGMRATGLPKGLASEGSFGPDPVLGIIPAACELLHFIDDTRGIEVTERLASNRTNYTALEVKDGASLNDFLEEAEFPSHGLLVKCCDEVLYKGITSRPQLDAAIAQAQARGACRVETDMRAHFNPTRMAEIAQLAERLAARLATPCPACRAPGFGPHAQTPGLECRDCGAPTALVRQVTHRCAACHHLEHRPRPDGQIYAQPQYCPECNP